MWSLMTTNPLAASSPPREGFFVSDGWAEPYQPGDLFQLATPDMSSKVAKQETEHDCSKQRIEMQRWRFCCGGF
jgi:hypothetical protein